MLNIKILVMALLAVVAVCGCGGSGEFFDEFRPRAATVSDIESKEFGFGWLPEGNPVQANLGFYDLQFGSFAGSNMASFTITERDGGAASGMATFNPPQLRLEVTSSAGLPTLPVGYAVNLTLEADENDGRIRLTNGSTSAEATSDPD